MTLTLVMALVHRPPVASAAQLVPRPDGLEMRLTPVSIQLTALLCSQEQQTAMG
jgi:hypothetical protein